MGMPHRLAQRILDFSSDVATARTPEIVLSRLQDVVGPVDVDVFAAGVTPNDGVQFHIDNWTKGTNLFFGTKQCDDYWPQCQKVHKDLGADAISIKSQYTTAPFTFAEAVQEKQRGSYIFEFLRSFDIVDGFYCPLRRWSVVYSSPRLLALSPAMRSQLISAAHVAVSRLETLVETERHKRTSNAVKQLTMREMEILQERARLHTNTAIARELNISKKTVDELLRRARQKLDAPDIAIALLTAYKLGLITF
jgi:DNA-binding CsgD family transcriptional regulator